MPFTDSRSMRKCLLRELGRVDYGRALELQQEIAADRKLGLVPDHLLLLEHPHVITLGRNGYMENLLASEQVLSRAGIAFYPTDRGRRDLSRPGSLWDTRSSTCASGARRWRVCGARWSRRSSIPWPSTASPPPHS